MNLLVRVARKRLGVGILLGAGLLGIPPLACVDDYYCSGGFSCVTRLESQCFESDGCYVGARCIGECPDAVDEAECHAAGCMWVSSNGQMACRPSPAGCAGYNETECASIEACTWGEGCTGEEIACSTFDSESDCAAHRYCSWRIRPDFN